MLDNELLLLYNLYDMNKSLTITVNFSLDGKTVKEILRRNGFSSANLRDLKKHEDGILLNGHSVHVNKTVNTGDVLIVTLRDEPSENIVPVNIPLDIIYEDEDVIAVNKPRGMPTHPSHRHYDDTLANGIAYYFREHDFTFRAVTRLDGDTSGIVLIAKNSLSAQLLNEDMKRQKIQKEYFAVVNGVPCPAKDIISAPIKRMQESVILRCVSPDGKEAVTEYEVHKTCGSLSLVHLVPRTGRTHQLRVHMSYIGMPIYGDDLYGAPQLNERTRLHCAGIVFLHPITKKEIKLFCPIPQDMRLLTERCENH
ncbi:MAG: RluA family pseudouridine synthase [Ruminococcaceae bacterium]|nr:RluA family pseudouridine synthase [Oscillospiraceae bacterium]